MIFKLFACDVFTREVCSCIAASPHTVDVEFTEMGQHDRSDSLREILQAAIDRVEASGKRYEAILLAYGLCGNATAGLTARTAPLVLPRAHDCCTIFLGSRARFKELFSDNPSRPFSSGGYMERGDGYIHDSTTGRLLGLDRTYEDFVAQYGEENARYIMESLAPSRDANTDERVVYIDIPETAQPRLEEQCRRQAEADGREFVRVLGDIRLIRMLIDGTWPPEEFLVVQPGQRVRAVYDWEEVVRAGP